MEARLDAFREITEFHLHGGTTSLTLTTLSAPQGEIPYMPQKEYRTR